MVSIRTPTDTSSTAAPLLSTRPPTDTSSTTAPLLSTPPPPPPPPPPPTSAQRPAPPPREKIHRPPFSPVTVPDPRIVFSFARHGTHSIREVVSMREIIEDGRGPSWEKLVRILGTKVDGVTVFDEQNDMILFNQYICVQNERQFSAALQWVSNLGERNVHVTIHEASEESRAKLWPKSE